MSKYDKEIAISREEEGTYHRREVTDCVPSSKPTTTYHTERYVVPKSSKMLAKAAAYSSDEDNDNYQEWTVSKRKINHTTRQVETRVSRQLLVEDGKVIADSGPQVTTRIKEDNKVEECEKEKAPKNKKGFAALENAPEGGESHGRVLGEKKEIQRVSREVREENMQYHDERLKELSGKDVHRRAIEAPHELMGIQEEHERNSKGAPRGKMVHYSNKGKKYQDTDEILEVAKLAIDGSVTKEVKRTRHHEEFSEDEKPDEKGEAEALRRKPIVERSSRRHVDYVNDFDDTATPDTSDTEGGAAPRRGAAKAHLAARRRDKSDEAFPRYEIDPLLNSLRDEDFRPPTASAGSRGRHVEHSPVVRSQHYDGHSSDDQQRQAGRGARHQSPVVAAGGHASSPVEIPEEYRVNKQRLMSGKSSGSRRSQSPAASAHQMHSKAGSRGARGSALRREDASVQARLTDEEEERRSQSSELNSHEKTTRYLQRQSTPNSSRHYYYGEKKHNGRGAKANEMAAVSRRRASISSASSSSVSFDEEVKMRKNGAQSRDSGFRSPAQRAQTPSSQIYSASSKSRKHQGRQTMVSPTPSAGQRSVKTTTTTMSAGLKDRPLSPEHTVEEESGQPSRPVRSKGDKTTRDRQRHQQQSGKQTVVEEKSQTETTTSGEEAATVQPNGLKYKRRQRRESLDTLSVSSLKGPNATTIKVPYKRMVEIEQANDMGGGSSKKLTTASVEEKKALAEKSGSEMSLQEDIENLRKRLAKISNVESEGNRRHFDYKTVVAQVQSVPKHRQIIETYNVHTIKQDSPFSVEIKAQNQQSDSGIETTLSNDNNNEAGFNLNDIKFKYRAIPALVEPNVLLTSPSVYNNEEDRMSQISSCSLHSSKTYNIRKVFEEAATKASEVAASNKLEDFAAATDCELSKKNPAWIFDPRDGSSTAIAPPPKPKKPPTPEVATEELAQAPGGRSYYLELIEREKRNPGEAEEQEHSKRALYSRWNSQGALNARDISSGFINWQPPQTDKKNTGQRKGLPTVQQVAQRSKSTTRQRAEESANANRVQPNNQSSHRRQLPYGGPPASLSNGSRSKSSSCLLSVTKPSKYSIYGGFRKPDETSKPVPRLSYSRPIGPRSQRQLDTHPKVSSRYLKMK